MTAPDWETTCYCARIHYLRESWERKVRSWKSKDVDLTKIGSRLTLCLESCAIFCSMSPTCRKYVLSTTAWNQKVYRTYTRSHNRVKRSHTWNPDMISSVLLRGTRIKISKSQLNKTHHGATSTLFITCSAYWKIGTSKLLSWPTVFRCHHLSPSTAKDYTHTDSYSPAHPKRFAPSSTREQILNPNTHWRDMAQKPSTRW